jgi:hypothetical protein
MAEEAAWPEVPGLDGNGTSSSAFPSFASNI